MTLGEFLHPLSKASQRDLVLATMYFLARYEGATEVTTSDLQAAFAKAKHTKGKKIQYATVLNRGAPYVHSPGSAEGGRLLWSLTDTGQAHVRALLELPADQPEVENDVTTLRALAQQVPDDATRGYIEESVLCLRVDARRAAVVFLWSGAAATIRDRVWQHGSASIDAAIHNHNPKAPTFKKMDDFSYVKDSVLLQVAQDLSVIDKTEKGLLNDALDLRNACGHPTKYVPGPKKVAALIEDLVSLVWR